MNCTRLTVELVESLQKLRHRTQPIDGIVEKLTQTTLAGIVEYCCIRHNSPDEYPPLPKKLLETQVAIALGEVASELGVRALGHPKPPIRNIRARTAEFHVVPSDTNLDEDVEWLKFVTRFERGATISGLSAAVATNLQSAMCEMVENTQIHSRSPLPALVGYETRDGVARFVVADAGIGIRETLRTNPKYDLIGEDVYAIQEALKPGVTRFTAEGGGFGFSSVFKSLIEQWGQLRFRSVTGCVSTSGLDVNVDETTLDRVPSIPGLQVSVACRNRCSGPNSRKF